jgi:uncharacterized protein YbcC (UPF0753/DUF2309 family)
MTSKTEAASEGDLPGAEEPPEGFLAVLNRAARLLPAQGPISVFVHHNTLHAFEDLPFEEAVVRAGEIFGCEPFLHEWRYRDELREGRILDRDLIRVLEEEMGPAGADQVGGLASRRELRLAMLRHEIRPHRGAELVWLLEETDAARRLREDLPAQTREGLMAGVRARYGRDVAEAKLERRVARRLWQVCLGAVAQVPGGGPSARPRPVRHRDLLLQVTGVDTDMLVHPLLIRFCAAYLDQGLSQWGFPDREPGMLRAFLRIYGRRGGPPEAWMRGLFALVARETAAGGDDEASILRSLRALGVTKGEWDTFTVATLIALRGWGGIIRQLELRPDRAPAFAPPATIAGFLAVRLLLERLAIEHVARAHDGYRGPLDGLREALGKRLAGVAAPTPEERAFPLFQMAQCLGIPEERIGSLTPEDCAAVLEEMGSFDEIERRRVFHLAYERRHAMEVLDPLAAHARDPLPPPPDPTFQAIFCIDEREESLRRHLEEVEPACETFGVPGYFGVAMDYRALDDPHAMPLCPITVRPDHDVDEVVLDESRLGGTLRKQWRRTSDRAAQEWFEGSRNPARGTVFAAFLGALTAVPLVLRVLFPRWAARLSPAGLVEGFAPRTRLALERHEDPALAKGHLAGFTTDEMATIVGELFRECGITLGRSPLVVIMGHGSSSLNNPHESAHDCGACGGGRGGPNARAFAQMANDPEVRALLAARGRGIPEGVWCVAAYHNTCDDAIFFFDEGGIPARFRDRLDPIRAALQEARARNAHERCRRFEQIPSWFPPALALAHVEDRAEDLAQPRPEYGHATNAVCIVGRRSRTRGLFLDRRAFLVSYDPARDDENGSLLAQVLAGSGPVGAGINLEYYFSYVDPLGYGCHTKLPHNVSGLLGVMDGHRSDLRTGLPWQMVEIHEPVRLLLIVESAPELLGRVLDADPDLSRLVRNRWIRVVAWRPDSDEFLRYESGRFVPHVPESATLSEVESSVTWYRSRRSHLPLARVRSSHRGAR